MTKEKKKQNTHCSTCWKIATIWNQYFFVAEKSKDSLGLKMHWGDDLDEEVAAWTLEKGGD